MSEESLNRQSAVDRKMLNEAHVLSRLQLANTGEDAPSHDELEQMLDHVVSCPYCQDALERSVTAPQEDPAANPSTDLAYELLMQVKALGNKVQERDDQIAAYAEMLEMSGEVEANREYSELSEHLKGCESCRMKVKDMQIALRQAEQVGLVAPLRGGTKARV
jgi:hypothetical protein